MTNRDSLPVLDSTATLKDVLRTSFNVAVSSMPVTASELLATMIRDQPQPGYTGFDLHLIARRLFRERGYKGVPIPARNGPLTDERQRRLIFRIAERRGYDRRATMLRLDPGFWSDLYVMDDNGSTEQLLMIADPFASLSHHSAMERHGLTERPGDILHLTAPRSSQWQKQAFMLMAERLAMIGETEMPVVPFALMRPRLAPQVRGVPVERHETAHPAPEPPVLIDGIRITAIGATFRDMLAEPGRCGGMAHVVAAWTGHAREHLNAIIAAIDFAPSKIVQARAGYLLEEVLGITDSRIQRWLGSAQRGSSRKLDPGRAYAPSFSKKWMISLNLDAAPS